MCLAYSTLYHSQNCIKGQAYEVSAYVKQLYRPSQFAVVLSLVPAGASRLRRISEVSALDFNMPNLPAVSAAPRRFTPKINNVHFSYPQKE